MHTMTSRCVPVVVNIPSHNTPTTVSGVITLLLPHRHTAHPVPPLASSRDEEIRLAADKKAREEEEENIFARSSGWTAEVNT